MARRILLTTLAAGLLCAKPAAARREAPAPGQGRGCRRRGLRRPRPCLGLDVISGGPGDDRINVVRGDHDTVRCGPGRDVVFADPADEVAADCEDVRR
jgi:hypothetical protein